VIAILLGLVVRQVAGLPHRLAPGVRVATKGVLQLAIVLLGSGLSLAQYAHRHGAVSTGSCAASPCSSCGSCWPAR
jgi:uncharacterized membrane protein YadS